jgi:class 3 adenylate cyclase
MESAGQARLERRLAAILAADVAGYSRLIEADEEGTLGRLKTLRRELFDPKIAEHHGRIPGSSPDLYPQVALGTVVPCKSTAEVMKAAQRWISTMRPSRRPLRGLLRLRNFLNAIKNSPHAEGAHGARLEARTASMQLFFAPVLRSAIIGG